MTVTSINACTPITATATYLVTVRENLTPSSVSSAQTICYNTTPSQLTATPATGGSSPYNYQWQSSPDGSSWSDISGATSTTYSPSALTSTTHYRIVSTDAGTPSCGNVTSNEIEITVTPELNTISSISSQIQCYGETATILLSASGGTTPYSYTFNSVTNGTGVFSGISGSTAGTDYNWSVTDALSCGPVTGILTVTEPPQLIASAAVTSTIDCNGETATVTITASGGTGSLEYTFNGITNSTGIFNNIVAGNSLAWSVTDANNCGPVTGNIDVTEPSVISITSANVTSPVLCNGATGTVTIVATGGTGTLSYTFNGQTNTTGIFNNVYAGSGLSYEVTDSNGCGPVYGTIDIAEPTAITASAAETTAITCNGGTATVTITASGGTAPLSYTFDGNTNATGIFTGISVGNNISWSVTDANTCGPVSGVITITEPVQITASVSETTSILCYGGTADIQINAAGGSGILQYTFDGVTNTTGTFTNISAANGIAWSVTDANNCGPVSGTFDVNQPTEIIISAISSNSAICEGATLSLTSSAAGGTGTLRYNWTGPNGYTANNAQNPNILNATPAATGTYTLTVTDANDCSKIATTDVTVYSTPTMNPIANITDCDGTSISQINFSGADSYAWTNDDTSIGLAASGSGNTPAFTMINTGDAPVTATITVTPTSNGCVGIEQAFTITVNPLPVVEAINNTPILCDDGTTSIILNSNVAGTTFSWIVVRTSGSTTGYSDGSGTSIEQTLSSAGTVDYIITPVANGCTGTNDTVSIEVISSDYDLDVTITSLANPAIVCADYSYNLDFVGNSGSGQSGPWWNRTQFEWESRFEWTNNNTEIGLGASGGPLNSPGNISFTTQNNTNEDQSATISITPWSYFRSRSGWSSWSSWEQLCSGNAYTTDITVSPFVINCPTDITANTDAGLCTATISTSAPTLECSTGAAITWYSENGATNDSGSGTMPAYSFATGISTITYTATKSPTDFRTCNFTVTVTDDEVPVLSDCTDINVPMDAGSCGAVITFNPTVTDNCDATVPLVRTDGTGLNSGDIFPDGTTTITYTATDAAGNVGTCSFDVTVAPDNENPVISCVGDQAECANAGLPYTITGTAWDATATDNCPGAVSLSYNLTGVTTGTGTSLNNVNLNVGTTTVTWTAIDIKSNSSSCSFDVVITEAPAITTQPVTQTVCLNGSVTFSTVASGTPAPTFQWRKNGADISGETNSTLIINPVLAGDAANYDVVVTNSCGTATSAPASLTVTTPPVITQQPANQTDCIGQSVEFTVVASGGVTPYSYVWEMRETSGDPWFLASTVINISVTNDLMVVTNIGDANNPDQSQYKVTVTDNCGNPTESAIATLTVNEVVLLPLVSETICQGGATTFTVATSGTSPVAYEWRLDGVLVSDGGPYSGTTTQTITITNADVTEDGIYSAKAIFNITQPNNNGVGVTTCEGTFTDIADLIIDEGPDIVATPATQTICPGSAITQIDLTNANGTPGTTYSWTRDNTAVLTGIPASGTGNTITGTLSSLDPGNTQTTTFTITAIANGCESTGTATVTVVDDTDPTVASCPSDISVNTDAGICGAVVNYVEPTFDDDCEGAGLNGTLDVGLAPNTEFPVGTTTVTYSYSDASGNGPATCSFDVIVTDNTNPTAVCQDITIELDVTGNVSITENDIDNGSSDDCGIASLAIDKSFFDCSDVGSNTVTLTVTDIYGNVSTCTSTVMVEDNIDPVAVCKDITVQLDAAGNASIAGADIDNGSTDNCGIASLTASPNAFTCSDLGANTVTLTVLDNNGNSLTCTSTVTVVDVIKPNMVCQDITALLDMSGNVTITPAQIDNGSSDNCTLVSLTLDETTFDCTTVGNNTVTLTGTDDSGNLESCTATVNVEDTEDPIPVCQDITVQLDASGNATITPAQIDNGSSDNCSIASLDLDITTFDCTDVGINQVILTVTDGYGNANTCTANVTVEDDSNPIAICQDVTIQLDALGSASIAVADINNGSSDNCGIASITVSQNNFDCTEVGNNTVTLTVTDDNSNTSTCTSTVRVEDNINPNMICQDYDIQLDGLGSATITVANIDNGSSDNCTIASLTLDKTTFNCSETGNNTVTLTGTDVNGNSATCTSIVTVSDTEDPTANCQDITVELDASGNATITTADINNNSTDNCNIASLSLDITTFNCTNLGDNTVTLTVTDDSGNTNTCTSTVTVADNTNPIDIIVNSITQSTIDCYGDLATVTIATTGGVGTLTYTFDGTSNNTGIFNNVAAGTNYNWDVTDALGCSTPSGTFDVVQPDELTATIANTDVTCSSGNDGTITISSSSGGSGSFEYTNDGGTNWQSAATFTGLVPGTYNVQMRDANTISCVVTIDAALEVFILTADVAPTNVTCNGAADGTITISNPDGGSGSYEFSIDNGANWQASGNFGSLTPATYNVQIRDANDITCIVVLDAGLVISEFPALAGTVNSTNVDCNGANNGTITISAVSGGSGTYEYTINGGSSWQATGTYTSLSPNTYDVRIRDFNEHSCELTLDGALVISEPNILSATVTPSNVTCNGGSDGSIDITVTTGGSGNYEYSIDGGTIWQSSGNFPNLIAGTYHVHIRDANVTACVIVLSSPLDITEPPALAITTQPIDFSDCKGSTVSFDVTVSGGVGTILYQWQIDVASVWTDITNGGIISGANSNNLILTGVTSANNGDYRVVVTDNCSSENSTLATLLVNEITAVTPNVVDSEICEDDNFVFDATTSGTVPVAYQWQVNTSGTWSDVTNSAIISGATTSQLTFTGATPAESGQYKIIVTFHPTTGPDCTVDSETDFVRNLLVNPTPTIDDPGPQAFCNQAVTTAVTLTGTPANVVFDITGGTSIGLADQTGVTEIPSFNSIAGSATITITPRANGCTGIPVDVEVTVSPTPTVTAPIGVTFCNGELTAEYALTGTPVNVVYDITGGAAIGLADVTDATGIPAFNAIEGVATITVTPKVGGCFGTPVNFDITVLPTPTATISGSTSVCLGSFAPNLTFTNPHDIIVKAYYSINGSASISVNIPANSTANISVPTNNAGVFDYVITSAEYFVSPFCANTNITDTATVEVTNPPIPTVTGPTEMCAGTAGNTYKTEHSMSNYVWSVSAGGTITAGGSGTDSTITVTWNNAGTMNIGIMYDDNNGCTSASATVYPVTVNQLPVPTITGAITACEGETDVVYTTQAAMINYQWNISAGGIITAGGGVNDNTVTVTWNTAGVQTVGVNYTNTNGCATGSPTVNNVTVNPTPTPTVTGDNTACSGTTGHVYTTEAGMTNYVWTVSAGGSISAGGTFNDNTATVTWNTAGAQTISINYENGSGCSALTDVVNNVTVDQSPDPTITGVSTTCAGITITYTTEAGMSNYVWTVSAGGTIIAGSGGSTDDFVTVLWNNTGNETVSVDYQNSLGCNAPAPTIKNITVNPEVIPTITGINSVCNGESQVYTTQTGMSNYIWTVVGGTITAGGTTSDNSATVTWDTDGTQTVSINYLNNTGCTSVTTDFDVTVNPLSSPTINGNAAPCLDGNAIHYTSEAGMTDYQWIVTAGGTITAGGTLTDDYADVTWNTTGNTTLTLNYTNASGCRANSATILDITVYDLPLVNCPADFVVCVNTAQFALSGGTPAGGVYSGVGVSGGNFDPATAGIGTHEITYTYTDANSCPNTCTFDIGVDPVPSAATQTMTICSGDSANIDLRSIIPGATFTWVATNPSGATINGYNSCNSSCDTIINDILDNTTNAVPGGGSGTNGVVRYSVTPTANGCVGNPFNINVTVRPALIEINLSWNSNFVEDYIEVCAGAEALSSNDIEIMINGDQLPPNGYFSQGGNWNPVVMYGPTADGPWTNAPGFWNTGEGPYQWAVDLSINNQLGYHYFITEITNPNTGCTRISNPAILNVVSSLTVEAGGPDFYCSSSSPSANALSGAYVGGISTTTKTGTWSTSDGGTIVQNTSNPDLATYRPPADYIGDVTLTLTTNDPDGSGDCVAIIDTRTITLLPPNSFTGCLDPFYWPLSATNSDGYIDDGNSPCFVTLVGSDNQSGSMGATDMSHCTGAGTVSFDWSFSAPANQIVWHQEDQREGSYTSSSNMRVARPYNVSEDDLIIVTIHINNNVNITPPSGFNAVSANSSSQRTNATAATFYKIATNSEPADYDFGTSGTVGSNDRIYSVRVTGHDLSSPIGNSRGVAAYLPPANPIGYVNLTISAINTTTANSMLVAVMALNSRGTDRQYVDYLSSPIGMTTMYYEEDETTSRVAQGIISGTGTTGDKVFSWPSYNTRNRNYIDAAAQMFVINPATPDVDAAAFILNGNPELLANTNGASGTYSISVNSGDDIAFGILTDKNTGGPGELTIYNLDVPNDTPELTGITDTIVPGCQIPSYSPTPVPPTVIDDCGAAIIRPGYPQTGAVSVNDCEHIQTTSWIYVDECNVESDIFTQTFTWTVIEDIILTCPNDTVLAECLSSAEIQAGYDIWKAGFISGGGCGTVATNINAFPLLPDLTCGGELEFKYIVSDDCGQIDSCTSKFTVATSTDLAVTAPKDTTLVACSSAAEIQAAYNIWVAGFTKTGGCPSVTDNLANIPALGDLTCGGQLSFTLVADYSATACVYSVDTSSVFTVETPADLEVTVPADVSLPLCSDSTTIKNAYDVWVAGFVPPSGCDVVTNIASIPLLGDLVCGGQLSFTFTADNGAGYCVAHSEDSSTFTVTDAPDLTITCPADPNVAGCSGAIAVTTAYNNWVDGFTASGGCDVQTNIDEIPPLNNMVCNGQLSFTFIAINGEGVCADTAECTQTFTIGTSDALVLSCPGDTIIEGCTAADVQDAFDGWIALFSHTGGCNTTETDLSFYTPPATCGSELTVNYIVSDECGEKDSCSATFRVEAPVLFATAPSDNTQPSCQTQAEVDLAFANWLALFGSTGGCNATGTDLSAYAPPDVCGGSVVINYTATDACGQSENSSAFFTIDAPNNVAQEPEFTVPADYTVYTDDDCNYDADTLITGVPTNLTDNCTQADLTVDYTDSIVDGSCIGTYIIYRKWEVSDECANITTHQQIINVLDTISPLITCPADASENADPSLCSKTGLVLGTATATDNCTPDAQIIITNDAPDPFPVGTTLVTWTATDDCGNYSTCTQNVTVIDITPPDLTISGCQDATENASANNCYKTTVTINDPVYSDDCWPLDSLTLTWTMTGATTGSGSGSVADSTFNVGVTTVEYTVSDPDGNSVTCDFDVTIVDVTPPNLAITGCEDVSDIAAANNCSKIPATLVDPIYSDDCWPIDSLDLSWIMIGATTGSGTGSVVGETFNVGVTIVEYTVTDPDGNFVTCDFEVTIVDITPPNLTITGCEDVSDIAAANNCSKIPGTLVDPTYSDDCWPVDSLDISWTMTGATTGSGTGSVVGETFNVGVTIVEYTVTDPDGNFATCDFEVTIVDVTPPDLTITGCVDVADTAAANNCSKIPATLIDPIYSDACWPVDSLELTWTMTGATTGSGTGSVVGETFNVGVTVVEYTVTDPDGNFATCDFEVKIVDVTPPNIQITGCEDVQETAAANNCSKTTVTLVDPTYSDDCWPVDSLSLTWVMTGATTGSGTGSVASETFNIGITNVEYTVSDPDGNFANCDFDVTIIHLEIPTANFTCPADTVYATPNAGDCYAVVPLGALTYVDPCNEIDSVLNESPYRTSYADASGNYPVGITDFTWYITDISGNIDSCLVTVIVEDLLPTLVCPPDIVAQADYEETFASGVVVPPPTFDDNCPDSTLTWVMTGATTGSGDTGTGTISIVTSPGTFNVGVSTITYTFTDANGHVEVCDFTITVESAPIIDCPPDTTVYVGAGDCINTFDPGIPDLLEGGTPIDWTWVMTGATTGTGTTLATVLPDLIGDTDFNIGTTTITWTAENVSGADNCFHIVTVIDTFPPIFTTVPFEDCVDPMHWATYDPANANPIINHIDPNINKYPSPDFHTLLAGSTDLDLLTLEDNCCDSVDMTINWRIDFTDTPNPLALSPDISYSPISGTGQPSTYGSDIELPGDGVYFNAITHTITFWAEDCNGNVSAEQIENIVITPRPQVIKEVY